MDRGGHQFPLAGDGCGLFPLARKPQQWEPSLLTFHPPAALPIPALGTTTAGWPRT